jgi:hypothetical protein
VEEHEEHSVPQEKGEVLDSIITTIVKNPGQAEPLNLQPSKERGKVTGTVEMEDVVPRKANASESHPNPPTSHTTLKLPSFPPPALLDTTSKSVLALQGLDQALVDAEVVNSINVLPIPEGEDDAGTRLSKRTRKRLNDLGITELFAGVPCIFNPLNSDFISVYLSP